MYFYGDGLFSSLYLLSFTMFCLSFNSLTVHCSLFYHKMLCCYASHEICMNYWSSKYYLKGVYKSPLLVPVVWKITSVLCDVSVISNRWGQLPVDFFYFYFFPPFNSFSFGHTSMWFLSVGWSSCLLTVALLSMQLRTCFALWNWIVCAYVYLNFFMFNFFIFFIYFFCICLGRF